MISEPSFNPSLPLAEQVADYYRSKIINGELRFGDELPPANQFEKVSHVTILNAYRKLAGEGYVKLQRAKRTRVAKNFENQRYVILASYKKAQVISEDNLFTQCQHLAFYKDRKPDVFYLGHGEDIGTVEEANKSVPDSLKAAINQGHVRGALIHLPDHLPGLTGWLRERNIPFVCLSPIGNASYIHFDPISIHEDAVRLLAGKGCRSIKIMQWHWQKPPKALMKLLKEFPGVQWGAENSVIDHTAPIEAGREFALSCLNSQKKPDALIVADDIVGLGALVAIKEKGLRIPQDIRLLVSSYRSQILPVFSGCDLIITPFDDLVRNSVLLLEDIIGGKETVGACRAIPHITMDAEETVDIGNLYDKQER